MRVPSPPFKRWNARVCSAALAFALSSVAFSAETEVSPAPNLNLDLPQLGEPADLSLSPTDENRLADEVMAELFHGEYLLEDPELFDYLNSLGWKLAAKASATPVHYRFFWLNDARINAFAVPGGLIGVNAGLLVASDNESELAGVIGHEQAHVTQRHIARTENDTSTANIATWAALIAAVLAGAGNGDAIIGAIALGQSINSQRAVNYTRAHELEADRIGIRTMAESGYDPEGMATFFSKLEQKSRLYGTGVPEFLRTHPVNSTRIAEARSRSAQMPKVTRDDPIEFSVMKARIEVLIAERPDEAVALFAKRMQSKPNNAGYRYGYAFALLKSSRADEAVLALQPLMLSMSNDNHISMLYSELLLASGKRAEGRASLAKIRARSPLFSPALFLLVQSYVDDNEPIQARTLLQSSDASLQTRPEAYKLLAEAALKLNNVAESQFQSANYQMERGDFGAALREINVGLRITEISGQDRLRLTAMRKALLDRIPESVLARLAREEKRKDP